MGRGEVGGHVFDAGDTGGSLHAALVAGQALGIGGNESGEGRVYRGANKAKPAPFSEAGGGAHALDALIRVAFIALTAWPGETALQKVSASVLLPALTRRRALCRACVNLPSWGQIVDAEAAALAQAPIRGGAAAAAAAAAGVEWRRRRGGWHRVPTRDTQGSERSFGRAAEGLNDEAQCAEYIARVLSPVGRVLQTVASEPHVIQHPGGESAPSRHRSVTGFVRATGAVAGSRFQLDPSLKLCWWCRARGAQARKYLDSCFVSPKKSSPRRRTSCPSPRYYADIVYAWWRCTLRAGEVR